MAIRIKNIVPLKVSAHCSSHSLADIRVRDIELAIDEPLERGGTNTGPTPTEIAVSALAACTNVIAHKCAKKLDIDIGRLKIVAECQFDRRGVTLTEEVDIPFQSIKLTITSDGEASAAELSDVATEVRKFCPLSKLFSQAGTEIQEEWVSS